MPRTPDPADRQGYVRDRDRVSVSVSVGVSVSVRVRVRVRDRVKVRVGVRAKVRPLTRRLLARASLVLDSRTRLVTPEGQGEG